MSMRAPILMALLLPTLLWGGCDLSTGAGPPPDGTGATSPDTTTAPDGTPAEPVVAIFEHTLAGPVAVGARVDVVLDLPAAVDITAVVF